MERRLRIQIVNEVKAALAQYLEGAGETYITGKELSQQFQMFSPDWLRRYGELLPRVQAIVTEDDGSEHKTAWCYPRNKIAKMVREGEIERLIMI